MKRTEQGAKKKKRISPASAKAKGRQLQQWVCQKIADLTGFEWGGSGEDKPIESRAMGQSGVDVRMESQVRQLFPYSVECKWQETWDIPAWIRQAVANQQEGTDWLLFVRRSRMKSPYAVVIMDAELFFKLQREANNGSSK